MTPPAVEIRSASPADLPALARFIAAQNAAPEGECLHCAAKTPAEARAALREEFANDADPAPADAWARTFALALRPDLDGGPPAIVGALGCQLDPSGAAAWLWGPWHTQGKDTSSWTPKLFAQMSARLPRAVRRVDAFLNSANMRGLRALQAQGFSLRQQTHIYVAKRQIASADESEAENSTNVVVGELRLSQETAFARLHAETFPAGESARAEDLLASRRDADDGERRIFAAADGLSLLGYVCVSINRAPREGFIDYLAVRPNARGRGVGLRLLLAAQRWIFEEQHLPQAALCVSDWRAGARRLYERAGFALYASGTGARLRW